MKHGPIALLDENTPVVVVATRMDRVYDKIVSNIQEVRARGAHVIAIASDGNEDIQHHADDVIYVPAAPAFLSAMLAVVPLQLLAYRIARLRGLTGRPAAQPRQDRHRRVEGLEARLLDWRQARVRLQSRVIAYPARRDAPPYRRRGSRCPGCRAGRRRGRRRRRGAARDQDRRCPVAVTMRTPGHDEELALGFCLSEGLGLRQRGCPTISRRTSSRSTRPGSTRPAGASFYTSSSCGVCGKGALEAVAVEAPRSRATCSVAFATVRRCPTGCARHRPAFAVDRWAARDGAFTAAGELLCVREDVGRHNAMDKVIGWAFREGGCRSPARCCA